jgi:hypothetical protein
MANVRVSDGRRQPWCWQEKPILKFIRKSFKAKEIATAIAIYTTLTEIASNKQKDDFNVTRADIGKMVGRSADSIDRYLNRFEELEIINKEVVVYDNWNRGLNIQLLGTPDAEKYKVSAKGSAASAPMRGVAEPMRPPNKNHVSEPMQGGSRTDAATSPHPFGDDIEESQERRILKTETATAAPSPDSPSADAKSSGRAQREVIDNGQVNAPAKKRAAKRLQGDGDEYLSLAAPGSGEALEEVQQGRKKPKKERKIRGGDPDKDPEEWDAYDAMAYFKRKWGKTFPGEIVPERKAHIPRQINGRIAWLKIEKHPASAMKRVIDHVFDNWKDGLADKIKWDGSRPAYGILASTWYFEKLFRLTEYGPTGKPKHDAFDKESAKRAQQSEDGWGV